jgi:hypothetical protein
MSPDITYQAPAADAGATGATPVRPALLAVALFVAVASLLFYRSSIGGLELRDFRDAIYYPVVALIDGNNPYDTAAYFRTYPVQQEFPPYLPGLLAIHLPFALFHFEAAQVVYFGLTTMLTVALACVTLLACGLSVSAMRACGLATLIIVSRPGYWNLALGQVTVPVVIGTYVALQFAEKRPWLAALGVALALMKPTYGVPVGVLLLARKNLRVVVLGGIIAGLVSAGPMIALVRASGGPAAWIVSLQESYAGFTADPDAGASSSPDRVDAAAAVARLLGHAPSTADTLGISLLILGLGGLAVWHLRAAPDQRTRTLSNSVACLSVLTCTYHQAYDLLLLALPLSALVTNRWAPAEASPRMRGPLLAVLMVPAFNYLCAGRVLKSLQITGGWWTVLTSVNGCMLLTAWCLYLAVVFRKGSRRG